MKSSMELVVTILVLLACTANGEGLSAGAKDLKLQERAELPACPTGYFFCTFHKLDCCSKQYEYCSSFSKACEKVEFIKPITEECCELLESYSKHDMRYEVGTMEEGRLQVCLYNLGLRSWNATCSEKDVTPPPTQATPEYGNDERVESEPANATRSSNCNGTLVLGIGIIIIGILIVAHLVFTVMVHWDKIEAWRKQNYTPATVEDPDVDIEDAPKDLKELRVRNRKPPSPGVSIKSADEENMNFVIAKKREI